MNVSNNNLFLIKMIYLIRRAMLVCSTQYSIQITDPFYNQCLSYQYL